MAISEQRVEPRPFGAPHTPPAPLIEPLPREQVEHLARTAAIHARRGPEPPAPDLPPPPTGVTRRWRRASRRAR